jgi:hypothetical protein
MEAMHSSETSLLTRAKRHNILEGGMRQWWRDYCLMNRKNLEDATMAHFNEVPITVD